MAIVLCPLYIGAIAWVMYNSNWVTGTAEPQEQPVPFSHEHHVRGDGIDCRYCHTSVETSSFAGIPPIHTCMTCHSQIFSESPMLDPVRTAWKTGIPLQWKRVNELPEFVFFNHSIHVAKGIGCSDCHGRVDRMPLTWKAHTLYMRWCLNCHTKPWEFIRPKSEVFNMSWTPPKDQEKLGRQLVREYGIDVKKLNDCYTCHR